MCLGNVSYICSLWDWLHLKFALSDNGAQAFQIRMPSYNRQIMPGMSCRETETPECNAGCPL